MNNNFIDLIEPLNEKHKVLLKLAEDAAWLIKQTSLYAEPSHLRTCYINLLTRNGYVSETGDIDKSILLSIFFEKYYSLDKLCKLLLQDYGYQYKMNYSEYRSWLHNLCHMIYDWFSDFVANPDEAHPLNHLVVIQILGCTPEEFFRHLFRLQESYAYAHEETPKTLKDSIVLPPKREGKRSMWWDSNRNRWICL